MRSQSVGIFGSTNLSVNATGAKAPASAIFEISATDKGLLIPQVSLTDVTVYAPIIGASVTSLLVYNTNAAVTGGGGAGYYYWDGSKWEQLAKASANTSWNLTGNSGTNSATNFIGTTDAVALNIRANNINRINVNHTGGVSIGSKGGTMTLVNDALTVTIDGVGNSTVLALYNAKAAANGNNSEARFLLKTTSFTRNIASIMGEITNITDATYQGALTFNTANNGTSPTEKMRIDNNGNVGIGTTTPSYKLHVRDNTEFGSAIYGENIFSGASEGFGVYGRAVNDADNGVGGWFEGARVGVRGAVQENGSAQTFAVAGVASGNTGERTALWGTAFGTGNTNYGLQVNASGAATTNIGAWLSASGGTNNYALVIPSTGGNVGIGTTAPSEKLQVVNNAVAADNVNISMLAGTTGNSTLFMGNSANNFLGAIQYDNSTNSMNFWTNNTPNRIKIDGSGNITVPSLVGPGYVNTDASGNLSVSGLPSGADAWTKSGAFVYTTTLTDYVGIGTSSPSQKLDVVSSGAQTLLSLDGNGNTGIILKTSGANNWEMYHNNAQSALYFYSNSMGDAPVVFKNSGYVGIGTLNPASKLHAQETVDGSKYVVRGIAGQVSTSTDYQNVGVYGYGKGGNSGWGYAAGVMGIGDQANSYFATGVYAGLSSGPPALPTVDAALYANGASIGYSGIFAGGNVGIGTSAPGNLLHVEQNVAAQKINIYSKLTTSAGAGLNAGNENEVIGSGAGNMYGSYNLVSNSGTGPAVGVLGYATGANSGDKIGGDFGTGGTAGTNYALRGLAAGAAATNIGGYFSATGATNNYAIIVPSANGNVGIGTTAPGRLLHLEQNSQGNLTFPLAIFNAASSSGIPNTATGILFTIDAGGNARGKGALVYNYGTQTSWNRGDFYFLQNSATDATNPTLSNAVMAITNAGNVGIGTTAPTALLNVRGGTGPQIVLDGTGSSGWMRYTEAGTSRGSIGYLGGATFFIADEIVDAFGIRAETALQMGIGNSLKMTIANSGNVGIGTASPQRILHIKGPDHGSMILQKGNDSYLGYILYQTSTGTEKWGMGQTGTVPGFSSNNDFGLWEDANIANTRFFVKAGGNVGIGTTNPVELLEVSGNTATIKITDMISIAPSLEFGRGGNWAPRFYAGSGTGQMMLQTSIDGFATSTDEYLFGSTAAATGFRPGADNNKQLGTASFRWTSVWAVNGTIQTSDAREKENVTEIQYGLKEVMKLRPVSYNWINDSKKTKKLGLIAQEVSPVIKEAVSNPKDTEPEFLKGEKGEPIKNPNYVDRYGMNYNDLIPVLIKSVQEQQQMIDSLKLEIRSLKKEVEPLKTK